ncbi:MAG: hypothetical protein KGI06_05480 [Candidatus Micrarchaeota archaeon]|nr:hypothetical protein [Candidatus Micrarchaeota archaeon]
MEGKQKSRLVGLVPENLRQMIRNYGDARTERACSRWELKGDKYDMFNMPLEAGMCYMNAAAISGKLKDRDRTAMLSLRASNNLQEYGSIMEAHAEIEPFGSSGKNKIRFYMKAFSSNVNAALLLNNMQNSAFNLNEAKLLLRAEDNLAAARSLVTYTKEKRFPVDVRLKNTWSTFNILRSQADLKPEFERLKAMRT